MVDIFLYISLLLCGVGLIFQWRRFKQINKFFKPDGIPYQPVSLKRIWAGALNTLIQIKLLKAGKIRWLMHFGLMTGFLYLLFVHGLHEIISRNLFDYYEPTIDPFQFLRNLSGAFVIVGCVGFLLRRHLKTRINRDIPLKYKGCLTILLILSITSSGFLLEASKIISEPVFMDMVDEYSDLDKDTGLDDLKWYWNKNFMVHFSQLPIQGAASLENGKALNEEYCISCHSDTQTAFLSFNIAKLISHFGEVISQNRADSFLYTLHYMLCLSFIACLPFSRLFHLILVPFASFKGKFNKENYFQKKAAVNGAALSACTNCGYCSEVCSVYPHFQTSQNINVLPHAKIESVKRMVAGDTSLDFWMLQKGNQACTQCHNCTDICPSGIDLQTLWGALDSALVKRGYTDNPHFFQQIPLLEWAAKTLPLNVFKMDFRITDTGSFSTDLSGQTDAFEDCIQCTICTNVCPVVEYDCEKNDYTPHQVMNLLRLGQKHLAQGTRMVHTCLTCYACQEICPQKIQVTDILLELRKTGSMKADIMKKTYLKEQGR